MFPTDLKYTKEHEWVRLKDTIATVGLTAHATHELGEIVYVELPDADSEIGQMDELGTVESVKTVSSIYMPMSGTITAMNTKVVDSPELINSSPYEDGWLVKLAVSDEKEFDDLMTPKEYEAYLKTL